MSDDPVRDLELGIDAAESRVEAKKYERDDLKASSVRPQAHPLVAMVLVFAGIALGFGGGAIARHERKCSSMPMPNDTVITLERTGCYGYCPNYTVSIYASGRVVFEGRQFVATRSAESKIPPEDVQRLFDAILGSCFMEARPLYGAALTDLPWSETTVRFDTQVKTVRHIDVGRETGCGMLDALTANANAIDRVAGTARWIGDGKAPRER